MINVKPVRLALVILGGAIVKSLAIGFVRGLRGKKEEPLPFNVVDHMPPGKVANIDLTVEAAAIHRATEIINKKIAAGEIRTQEQLRDAVLQEFSFQKIAIHEQL